MTCKTPGRQDRPNLLLEIFDPRILCGGHRRQNYRQNEVPSDQKRLRIDLIRLLDKETGRLIIITGGPGSGKSTLISALQNQGFAVMPEAGRAIIQDQLAIGGETLPWIDPKAFADWMLCWELRSYREASTVSGLVFFDRGIPDVAGYLRLMDLPVPKYVARAIEQFRYSRQVFIAPPWAEIFTQDAERKQSFEEAVRTYDSLAATYREHGYALVELPCAPVPERVGFVLERLDLLAS